MERAGVNSAPKWIAKLACCLSSALVIAGCPVPQVDSGSASEGTISPQFDFGPDFAVLTDPSLQPFRRIQDEASGVAVNRIAKLKITVTSQKLPAGKEQEYDRQSLSAGSGIVTIANIPSGFATVKVAVYDAGGTVLDQAEQTATVVAGQTVPVNVTLSVRGVTTVTDGQTFEDFVGNSGSLRLSISVKSATKLDGHLRVAKVSDDSTKVTLYALGGPISRYYFDHGDGNTEYVDKTEVSHTYRSSGIFKTEAWLLGASDEVGKSGTQILGPSVTIGTPATSPDDGFAEMGDSDLNLDTDLGSEGGTDVDETGFGVQTLRTLALTVPFYSQQDRSWACRALGTRKQGTSCKTTPVRMQNYGCAVTSVAMVLKALGVSLNPGQLNDWLKKSGGFNNGDLLNWCAINQYCKNNDCRVRYFGSTSNPAIAEKFLGMGGGVIGRICCKTYLGVPTHFVTITGGKSGAWMINDPWKTKDSLGKGIAQKSSYSFNRYYIFGKGDKPPKPPGC